jgi:hypothetical protein
MNKILKYVQIISFVCIVLESEAQCIQFTYDAAGNRIQRSYNPSCTISLINKENSVITTQLVSKVQLVGEEIDSQARTTIYPNPTQSIITIRTNEFSQEAQIAVYNSTGAIVITRGLTSDQIDLSRLPSGSYVILIMEQQGDKLISYHQKIIKQ